MCSLGRFSLLPSHSTKWFGIIHLHLSEDMLRHHNSSALESKSLWELLPIKSTWHPWNGQIFNEVVAWESIPERSHDQGNGQKMTQKTLNTHTKPIIIDWFFGSFKGWYGWADTSASTWAPRTCQTCTKEMPRATGDEGTPPMYWKPHVFKDRITSQVRMGVYDNTMYQHVSTCLSQWWFMIIPYTRLP